MLGWLIVLCPLAIAICPAAPPLVVVAARSATGGVTDRAVPTVLRRGAMARTKAGLARLCPGDGMRRAQRTGSLRGLVGSCRTDGCNGGGYGHLTVAHIPPTNRGRNFPR